MSRALVNLPSGTDDPPTVLETHQLGVTYRRSSGFGNGPRIDALNGVDLRLNRGEILGIIGPSGSGKSTLGRCLSLHQPPTRGRLKILGEDPWLLRERQRRRRRPGVQWIPQDPAAALNPRFDVEQVLAEPLRHAAGLRSHACSQRIDELLLAVELSPAIRRRPCQRLSGGQKQRLVIARALAAEPHTLVFDEALAAVDGPQRRQLTQLLQELLSADNLSYVWISHDLHAVAGWTHRILILSAGRIVEEATPDRLLSAPRHPTTQALVEAL